MNPGWNTEEKDLASDMNEFQRWSKNVKTLLHERDMLKRQLQSAEHMMMVLVQAVQKGEARVEDGVVRYDAGYDGHRMLSGLQLHTGSHCDERFEWWVTETEK
jgi:hypothetical protein